MKAVSTTTSAYYYYYRIPVNTTPEFYKKRVSMWPCICIWIQMYAPNTYWTLGSAKWRCIYADEVYLHLLPLFNLMEDNGTVFNLFLLLFPSFSSTDEKERAWLTSRCNFSFRPGLEPKKSRQFKLDWFCCTFLLSQWMVRGIMYFDFGAKMLGKMLTEENDTSLTSFFFYFVWKCIYCVTRTWWH